MCDGNCCCDKRHPTVAELLSLNEVSRMMAMCATRAEKDADAGFAIAYALLAAADALGEASAAEAAAPDEVPWEHWYPMDVGRTRGEDVVLLLARVEEASPGCEVPVIGHFHDGEWWSMGYPRMCGHKLIPIGWMPRPEFVQARARLNRQFGAVPEGQPE